MNYLHTKKQKNRRYFTAIFLIVVLFCFIFFYHNISSGFSGAFHYVARPIFSFSNFLDGGLNNLQSFFKSKNSLLKQNEDLRRSLLEKEALLANYDIILDENLKLKEDLGRNINDRQFILASILLKPNQSLYDTLIIDIGSTDNIAVGDKVFAYSSVPIGLVNEVYAHSSKVILFSTAGENTEVVVAGQDVFMNLVGRGGGNFEMIIPRDFELLSGTLVHLPDIHSLVVAKVETIISDPRDSVKKALLVSPVNIQNLKFVQVEK